MFEVASACIAEHTDQGRRLPPMGTGMCSLYRLLATTCLLPALDITTVAVAPLGVKVVLSQH